MSAMAYRLLGRSEALALSRRILYQCSTLIDPIASAQCFRALGTLIANPLHERGSAPVFAPLGSGKIFGAERIYSNRTYSSLHGSMELSACSFHNKAHYRKTMTRVGNMHLHNSTSDMVHGVEANPLKGKHNGCSKVMAFSPLERKSGLPSESLKVKRMELSIKATYALIPVLLLVSKTNLTTSMLVFCIYWQIYWFFKEIFLDYVHHEVTRKWVLIYFKLLLLVLAKDTILAFDLV
ncbi:hypothetical protein Cni_G26219 [Canna indica]|uniref:Succinate dehydrogenase subunit 4 n=1 Tax=Canna indica TaxID=4628 RepID=A0AAQ3KYL1_9LILI|nr:hypothetical protein Cni_G26219 [Canna indica]